MMRTLRGSRARLSIGRVAAVAVAAGTVAVSVLPPGSATGTCDKSCLGTWPALTVPAHAKATAGPGVQKSKLGVTTDMAGARQVTYNGQPVYWFSSDKKGQVTGNITDQWGTWTVVVLKKPAGSSGTSTTSNAGSGGVSF